MAYRNCRKVNAKMARVQVIKEVEHTFGDPESWVLLFQWCMYIYDNGESQKGYRFIWRRPKLEGWSLQAARGQARIPSLKIAKILMKKAEAEGWGDLDGDE